MRRAGRTDSNQQSIVDVLRFIGASVVITSGAGDGFPDLLVGWRGETTLMEIKDGRRKPSERRLTADEQWFRDHWRGRPIVTVESETEALYAIGFSAGQAQLTYAAFLQPRPKPPGSRT